MLQQSSLLPKMGSDGVDLPRMSFNCKKTSPKMDNLAKFRNLKLVPLFHAKNINGA